MSINFVYGFQTDYGNRSNISSAMPFGVNISLSYFLVAPDFNALSPGYISLNKLKSISISTSSIVYYIFIYLIGFPIRCILYDIVLITLL